MRNKTQDTPPEGFRYQVEIMSINEEQGLLEHIRELPRHLATLALQISVSAKDRFHMGTSFADG